MGGAQGLRCSFSRLHAMRRIRDLLLHLTVYIRDLYIVCYSAPGITRNQRKCTAIGATFRFPSRRSGRNRIVATARRKMRVCCQRATCSCSILLSSFSQPPPPTPGRSAPRSRILHACRCDTFFLYFTHHTTPYITKNVPRPLSSHT